MMDLRASGVSGRPDEAPCLAIRSTVRWLIATPLTVAAAGPVAATSAGLASLAGLHAARANSDTALARSCTKVLSRMGGGSMGLGPGSVASPVQKRLRAASCERARSAGLHCRCARRRVAAAALGAGLRARRRSLFDGRFSYTEITLPRAAARFRPLQEVAPCKSPRTSLPTPSWSRPSAASTTAAPPSSRPLLLPLVSQAAERKAPLVLDFAGVDYISSVGLRVLMIAARQMRAAQAQLSVAALQSVVAEIFSISRFDKVLAVSATLEDALAQASRCGPGRVPARGPTAMKSVRFWGTRGSLPVALTSAALGAKLRGVLRAARGQAIATDDDIERLLASLPFALAGTYGGHSSCVQIQIDEAAAAPTTCVCDMGSGLRPFGQAAMAQRAGKAQTFHIFMSHLHWDHIMGLPFFVPAFIPGNRVIIYGSHRELEFALRRQQEPPSLSGGLRHHLRRPHRVPPPRARRAARGRRTARDHHAAAPHRRFLRLPLRSAGQGAGLQHRFRAPAGRPGAHRALRAVLPRRRPGDLRRHVLAGRRHLGQGRLGPLQQRRRRRAVPAGRRAPPVPVPPRAGVRRRGHRGHAGRNPAARGDHPRRGAAARQRGLRRAGNRTCERAAGCA